MCYIAIGIETFEAKGLMDFLTNPAAARILGASMLMSEGDEIMSVIQVTMMCELKYSELRNKPFAHPTCTETLNKLFVNVNE
ncbi:MAG: hypothetical protein K9G47_12990 [Bacteroidales bacterium]|nr:hypothetical protein [Bacteroidales bacterium]MCF8388791.1 hypothetical protein [Bacteroidales bacterium]